MTCVCLADEKCCGRPSDSSDDKVKDDSEVCDVRHIADETMSNEHEGGQRPSTISHQPVGRGVNVHTSHQKKTVSFDLRDSNKI